MKARIVEMIDVAVARFAPAVVDDVLVGLDQAVTDLVIPLGPGETIAGSVTRADGAPVVHVGLAVTDGLGREVLHLWVDCDPENGGFVLEGVPAGTVTLRGWTRTDEFAEVAVEISVEATSRVDLVLEM